MSNTEKNQFVSIAVPLFNEEECIEELCRRIIKSVDGNEDYELLFVLDGCTDGTYDILCGLQKEHPQIKIYELSRNFGLQAAVRACLELSKGDYVIILDGDLQDPPEIIPELLAKAREGYEVVYAQRRSRKENFIYRILFHSFYTLQRRLVDFEIPMQAGNYSCMSRKAVDCLLEINEANPFFPGLRSWIGQKSTGVEYNRDARVSGRSKQSLMRLISYALDGLFNFTSIPLIISFILGIVSLAFGFFMISVVLYKKLVSGTAILGWTSTIITVCFFGGVQLISIGILGSYIRRIFATVQKRPFYFLKSGNSSEETK